MKWVKRTFLVMSALMVLIIVAVIFSSRHEQPVSRMTSGDSEVLVFGKYESFANTPVEGGIELTLNGRHRVVLANRELSVNDVLHGRDFSQAEIRLAPDGRLKTVVYRDLE